MVDAEPRTAGGALDQVLHGSATTTTVILPSFFAFYMNWPGAVVLLRFTPVVLLGFGGLIGALCAAMGSETYDVDF